MGESMRADDAPLLLGVLDVFGFENFPVNSLEQFCINHANEQLQQFFTQFIFSAEQTEYEAEGVPVSRIEFTDNSACLDLVTAVLARSRAATAADADRVGRSRSGCWSCWTSSRTSRRRRSSRCWRISSPTRASIRTF
jgi:hypothetical protein